MMFWYWLTVVGWVLGSIETVSLILLYLSQLNLILQAVPPDPLGATLQQLDITYYYLLHLKETE